MIKVMKPHTKWFDAQLIPLQRAFLSIPTELEVEVSFDKVVRLEDGTEILAPVYMPQFGGSLGILIFDNWKGWRSQSSAVTALGYACSVLGPWSSNRIDLPSTREMLEEWGWSGSEEEKPAWFGRTLR